MAYEWVMFPAAVSRRKNPEKAFVINALRLHLLDGNRQNESVGYIEQRLLSNGATRMFFLTVLRGEHIVDQHIDDIQSGMDILDLVSRERKANE